ncbi:MAG: hypothetical protein DMF84_28605 [Acidobacteria bacterium]|nr:MAG: hypothetical protein DMF84_28605 [Acidobacteriota bacterium]
MRLFGDRFLVDDEDALDLASGERVRLTIDEAPAREVIRDREAACSELAGIRHPLLVPIVDFGLAEGRWFEAHVQTMALRSTRDESRSAALHLVRFMRARGVIFSGEMAARHVRPAVNAPTPGWRPLGLRLVWRRAIDAVRAAMEAHGPPGVTRITVTGPCGSGLRTARVVLSRAARLAGFLPIDRRVEDWMRGDPALAAGRHLCVIDWLSSDHSLPLTLSIAAAASSRRHLWMRFCREHVTGEGSAPLEPLTVPEMRTMIYHDAELGPDSEEVDAAIAHADGLPGRLIQSLTSTHNARSAAVWVHEVAPDYLVTRPSPAATSIRHARADAGVPRLERVVEAARALVRRGRHARAERLLRRASEALAARGASDRAASAACDLGELRLTRGRPGPAREAFARARAWAADPRVMRRMLIGTACAMRDEGALVDAEAPLRSVIAAESHDRPDVHARCVLAEVLMLRDEIDAAWQVMEPVARSEHRGSTSDGLDVRAIAMLAEIHQRRGDLAKAARLAAEACRLADPRDHRSTCEAQLAILAIHAALGNAAEVRRCADLAMRAARAARSPVLRMFAAARVCAALADCGTAAPSQVDRLLKAASKLPPLQASRIKTILCRPSPVDAPTTRRSAIDLLESFTELLHEAGTDTAALAAVASRLAEILCAASVRIHSGSPRQTIASAGRDWTDERLVNRVLDGGAAEFRDGAAPEAVVAVRAGGATIGCLAVRWVTGSPPSRERAHEILRLAAAACAPLVREIEPRRARPGPGPHPDDLLGDGASADKLRDEIRRASLAPYPVLIEGGIDPQPHPSFIEV